MALDLIGVLPPDYNTFSWNDWPESRSALASGGLVSDFQKATWNAIVSMLNNVLMAIGLQWDDQYTSMEGAIIGDSGILYANMFNSVRHNIDLPAKTGWAWCSSTGFRGYVGRDDFFGVSTHGGLADPLYPEYILELVRKLNLLIDILRGSGPLSDMASISSVEYYTSQTLDQLPMYDIPIKTTSEISSNISSEFEFLIPTPMMLDFDVLYSSSESSAVIMTATAALPKMVIEAVTEHRRGNSVPVVSLPSIYDEYHFGNDPVEAISGIVVPAVPRTSTSTNDNETNAFCVPSISLPTLLGTFTSSSNSAIEGAIVAPISSRYRADTYSSSSVNGVSMVELCVISQGTISAEIEIGFMWMYPEWVNDDGWLFHQVYDYNYDEETGILEVI